jgi:hypothetical protein
MGNQKRLRKFKKDNKDLIEDTHHINKQKVKDQDMKNLKDDDLFTINEKPSQKIKLREDRFVRYNSERSKNERDKVKKLIQAKVS